MVNVYIGKMENIVERNRGKIMVPKQSECTICPEDSLSPLVE